MNLLATLRIRALPQILQNFIRLLFPMPRAAVPVLLHRLKQLYIDINSQVYCSATTLARQLIFTLMSRNTVPAEILDPYFHNGRNNQGNCATYDRGTGEWIPVELKKSLKLHLLQITNFDCSKSDRIRLSGVVDKFSIIWDNMNFGLPVAAPSHGRDWMRREEEKESDVDQMESDGRRFGIIDG